jgi:FixJ family two-component response regulator
MTGLPAASRALTGAAKVAPGRRPPKSAETDDAGVLVCVVDDDEAVRESFRTLLETIGFAVTTYACGRDVIGDDRRHRASCFIVDQHMPGMDGLTTLGTLRRNEADALTILITGCLDAEIAARAAALEVGLVLEKPFSVKRLLEVLRAHGEPRR